MEFLDKSPPSTYKLYYMNFLWMNFVYPIYKNIIKKNVLMNFVELNINHSHAMNTSSLNINFLYLSFLLFTFSTVFFFFFIYHSVNEFLLNKFSSKNMTTLLTVLFYVHELVKKKFVFIFNEKLKNKRIHSWNFLTILIYFFPK